MPEKSVMNGMIGLIFSAGLQRAAEILRGAEAGKDEREMWADLFDMVGKEGMDQEALKLATRAHAINQEKK